MYQPRYKHHKDGIGGSDPVSGDWLLDLIHTLPKGATVAEVGWWLAGSSVDIASILKAKGGKLTCVDLYRAPQCDQNIKSMGVGDTIQFIQGTSWEVPTTLTEQFDLVFVDADHSYESVKKDLLAWIPRIKPGGILLNDDSDWPSVKQALDEVMPNAYDIRHRFAISRKLPDGTIVKYY